MRILFAFAALTAILPINIARAHGTPFFEFTPAISRRFNVAAVQTPSQPFNPQNDSLAGFDLWIDNDGPPGSAAFELRTGAHELLAETSVTVPMTARVGGGTRFHVNFTNPVPVSNAATYELTVRTSMTTLWLSYGARNQLLSHNSPSSPDYETRFVGPLRFGTREQDTTLKIALYETQEYRRPLITNATTTAFSPTSVQLRFNANEPVDYRVDFGPEGQGNTGGTAFTNAYEQCTETIGPCALTLSVEPARQYHYALTAKDEWGNETQAEGVFTSISAPPEPSPTPSQTPTPQIIPPANFPSPSPQPRQPARDTDPPIISNARVASVSERSVRLVWRTNEAADAAVTIRRGGELAATARDAALELEHGLESGEVLLPQIVYRAELTSRDAAGNAASAELSFTTRGAAAAPNPVPAGVNPVPSPLVAPSPVARPPTPLPNPTTGAETRGFSIAWEATAEEPQYGYRVDVFDAKNALAAQQLLPPGVRTASFKNLPPATYRAIVYENRADGFRKITAPVSVTLTDNLPVPTPVGNTKRSYLDVILAVLAATLLAATLVLVKKRRKKHSLNFLP